MMRWPCNETRGQRILVSTVRIWMRPSISIAIPPRMKFLRLVRNPAAYEVRVSGGLYPLPSQCLIEGTNCWDIWIHTADFVLGTKLRLHSDGRMERITIRADEGDDIVQLKPAD